MYFTIRDGLLNPCTVADNAFGGGKKASGTPPVTSGPSIRSRKIENPQTKTKTAKNAKYNRSPHDRAGDPGGGSPPGREE